MHRHAGTVTPLTRALSALLSAVVLLSSLGAATPAFASRLATDRVGGYPLSSQLIVASTAPDVTAATGALVAGDRVLWSRGLDTKRRMASTTKVMTALVVLQECRLDEVVKVTEAAARTPYALGLRTGEKRSVRTLLELTLVASSNDAANALAIHVAGSRSEFVAMMNARARKLGLANTHFANAHGLDATGHYSSAKDLARLMRAAARYDEFRRIIKKRSVYFPAYKSRGARYVASTDKLLGEVEGLRGGKTGYTNDARYCFVADARRDGVTLTSVVLGSSSSSARFSSSKRLLEWGFKNYRVRKLGSIGQDVGAVPFSGDSTQSVVAELSTSVATPVLGLLGPVTRVVELQPSVTLPVTRGQKLGTVRWVQNAEVIATADAVAVRSCEATAGVSLAQ